MLVIGNDSCIKDLGILQEGLLPIGWHRATIPIQFDLHAAVHAGTRLVGGVPFS